jgi:hypothetical protein
LSLGDINPEAWSTRLGVGLKAEYPFLQKIIAAKSKELKTGWSANLAESSTAQKWLFCQ